MSKDPALYSPGFVLLWSLGSWCQYVYCGKPPDSLLPHSRLPTAHAHITLHFVNGPAASQDLLCVPGGCGGRRGISAGIA
ncbi:hypothetical protein AB205_0169200 [Aquarana catesbeiana]|uniref:Uncharacterized protein n=1 Tax=Aquarana catesbeiana TaxID=8400 RepID=A0A2G9RAQ1_AQUCT|nr:hypothetical protein AB205_0169200 [Aquarana catesbeiana]